MHAMHALFLCLVVLYCLGARLVQGDALGSAPLAVARAGAPEDSHQLGVEAVATVSSDGRKSVEQLQKEYEGKFIRCNAPLYPDVDIYLCGVSLVIVCTLQLLHRLQSCARCATGCRAVSAASLIAKPCPLQH
jgi:hypothetical protein